MIGKVINGTLFSLSKPTGKHRSQADRGQNSILVNKSDVNEYGLDLWVRWAF